MKYGMVIDITKCNGCYNCFLACRDEHCGNDFPPYTVSQPHTGHYWMRIVEKERGQFPRVKVAYQPTPCFHCEEAPCVAAAPDGAIYKREDGIVVIDPTLAQGQRRLVDTCPYQVIFWNEDAKVAQKCTLCAHLLDQGWREPRCVEACPTGALMFGDLDDPESEVAKLVASGKTEVLRPDYGLKEQTQYIGLPKRFIAGAVVFGDTDKCGEGAEVTVEGSGAKRVAQADSYGDFEFEDLQPNGQFTVTVKAAGYEPWQQVVHAVEDIYLGDIVLTKAGGR